MSNVQAFSAVERVLRRVMLAIGRGRVTAGNDDGNVQKLQIQLGAMEIRDDTPRLAEYGFSSYPPMESDVVAIFVGGDRSNGIIIATGNQTYRFKSLKEGECVIHDNLGQSVYLSKGGIVVNGAGLPVVVTNTPSITLDTPTVHATGNMTVDGNLNVGKNIVAQGDISDAGGAKSMSGMRQVYDGHGHPLQNVMPGGSTLTTNQPNQQQ
ncbi:MAG: phage baseplate assembly protein V [Collimonas sp.]|uniref:phage baseplate assembly protein V n=1 Tax=Collimonas sp. TaxID=1963772 RepID=UPI003267777E